MLSGPKGQSDLVMLGKTNKINLNFRPRIVQQNAFFSFMWDGGESGLLNVCSGKSFQMLIAGVCYGYGLIAKTATQSLTVLRYFMHLWVSRLGSSRNHSQTFHQE